jgi:hypothetical protein
LFHNSAYRQFVVPPVWPFIRQVFILPEDVTVTASHPPALCMNHSNPLIPPGRVQTAGFAPATQGKPRALKPMIPVVVPTCGVPVM